MDTDVDLLVVGFIVGLFLLCILKSRKKEYMFHFQNPDDNYFGEKGPKQQ